MADACRGHRVVAVNDAYRLFPAADVLYAADAKWWEVHDGCSGHPGEKWTVRHPDGTNLATAERFGLNVIDGRADEGFSTDPARIHFGSNSGFQAINLAILFGARVVVLVGFNMQVLGKRHFFGDHPAPLNNTSRYVHWLPKFEAAAKRLRGVRVINATPQSALTCFERMELADALAVAAESGGHSRRAGPDRPGDAEPAHVP